MCVSVSSVASVYERDEYAARMWFNEFFDRARRVNVFLCVNQASSTDTLWLECTYTFVAF